MGQGIFHQFKISKMKGSLRSNSNQSDLPLSIMPANPEEVEFYEILTPVYIAKPLSSLRKQLPRQVKKKTNPIKRAKPAKHTAKTRTLKASFNPIKKIKKVADKMSEKVKQFKKTKMALNKMPPSENTNTLASTSSEKLSSKSSSTKQGRHILLSANPPKEPKKLRRPNKKRNLSSSYRRRLLPLRKSHLEGLIQEQLNGASKQSGSSSKKNFKNINSGKPYNNIDMLKDEYSNISNRQVSKNEDSKVALKSHIKKIDDTKASKSSNVVQKDVETVVTVEKHPGDDNKLDIDLDTTVDPQTSKPIKVHTHAEVDKNKMKVHGKADAKVAKGKAQIEGQVFHQGSKDNKIIELEVVEDDYDSDEISLEAKTDQDGKNEKNFK